MLCFVFQDPDRAPSELAPVDDDAANAVVVPTLSTKTAVFTVKITAEGADVEFGAPAGLVVITAFTGYSDVDINAIP